MSLAGSGHSGPQHYAGPSAADVLQPPGAPTAAGPSQQVWPGSQYSAVGQELRTRLEAKIRAEGHEPRQLMRRFVDLAATSGVTVAAVKLLAYIGVEPSKRMIGAAVAFLAAAAMFRGRRDPGWSPDWALSTGSPTRDAIRVLAAAAATIGAAGWIVNRLSGLSSWFRTAS